MVADGVVHVSVEVDPTAEEHAFTDDDVDVSASAPNRTNRSASPELPARLHFTLSPAATPVSW